MKLVVVGLICLLSACSFTAANAYRAQQKACVEDARTLQESQECIARVRHEWGTDLEPTITDAGADHAAE